MPLDRCATWLAAAALTVGLSIGTLTGAAVAVAEPESGGSTSSSADSAKTTAGGDDSRPSGTSPDRRRAGPDRRAADAEDRADRPRGKRLRIGVGRARSTGVETVSGTAGDAKRETAPVEDAEEPADEADDKPVVEPPADEQPVAEEPVAEPPADEESADPQPVDELPVTEVRADEQPAEIPPSPSPGDAPKAHRSTSDAPTVDPTPPAAEEPAEPAAEPVVVPAARSLPAPTAPTNDLPDAAPLEQALRPTALVDDVGPTHEAAVTVASFVAPPPAPRVVSPIEAIGTFIYNLVAFAGQALIPAPVIPAGSSVTMGRSTLQVPCGCGQTVDATWYFPDDPATRDYEAEPAKGVIHLQHGFFRNHKAVSALAIQLAERTDSVVVTPTITSNFFAGDGCWINGEPMQHAVADLFADRAALTASAAAAGWQGELPDPYILAGHSAGGGLAVAAASHARDDEDLAGVVMFDGVSLTDGMARALAALDGTGVQVLQIAAPNAVWNSFGSGTADLVAARPGQFVGVMVVGGTHIDSEGASSDLFARLLLGTPRPENSAAVQTVAAQWMTSLLAGQPVTGPAAGTRLPVGGATVVVLPAPRTPTSDLEALLREFIVFFERILFGSGALLAA